MKVRTTRDRVRAVAAACGVVRVTAPSAHAALTAPVQGSVYRGDVPYMEDTGGRIRSALTPSDVPNVSSLNSQAKLDQSAGGTLLGAATGCLVKGSGLFNSNVTNPLRTLTAADTATQGSVVITRDSDGSVVLSQGHLSNQDFLTAPAPSAAQPFGGTWVTQGAQAGNYTATSYKRDIVRGNPAAPVLSTDTDAQKAAKRNALATCRINGATSPNDVVVSTVHFVYRPWEQRFRDVLQTEGGVDFNLNSSREFQLTLRGGRQSDVIDAPGAFTVVKLPDSGALVLPEDPAVCGDDVAACLPPTPPSCESRPSSCTDRLVVLNYDSGGNQILGFFDLETRAFVASVKVGDSQAILKSAGDLDAQVLALKQQLIAAAAPLGIDAGQLSAMKISSVSNGVQTALSLDQGLEVLAGSGLANGATVQGGPSAEAGVIVHAILGGWRGTAAGPYTTTGGDLTVPAVPGLPALPALPAPLTSYGPLIDSLVGTSGVGAREIRAAGYTGGLHIYALAAGLEPADPKLVYIPTDAGTVNDTSIDFIGAPLSVTQGGVCTSQGACVGIGFLVGAGGAVYNSPLTLPSLLG